MKRVRILTGIIFLLFAVCGGATADGPRNVYILAVDGMRGDYLSTKGADGASLTPNLDAFMKKSVTFANCFDELPAFTDTNHFGIISSAGPDASGIWGAGGFYAGFDDKGEPVLRLYDYLDAQAPTLYDSVKQADSSAKTAVVSGKHWVAELFANNNPAVDVEVHGRKYPDYVNAPQGYWLGGAPEPRNSQKSMQVYLRGEDEQPLPGLIGMVGMTAADSPSDDWVTDAAIAVVQKENPAFAYILYADMDTAGHMYGSYNVPADWSGIDNQDAMRRQMQITDAAVGRFLKFLADSGKLDDSIVVITADHGMTSTRESFQLPDDLGLGSASGLKLLQLLQSGKVGKLAVDVKKILADKGFQDRMSAKNGDEPDYDYVFSEASSVYVYGVKNGKSAEIAKIIKDWNGSTSYKPIWLALTRDDMKKGVDNKTGLPYHLFNEKNAKNACPKVGRCSAEDGSKSTGVPWPDVAVFMNEGYINVVYPEEIMQGAFAVMKSAALNNLPIKLPPLPVVPGSHGTWAEQHVPLLIHAPGLAAGTVIKDNVSLLDITPTIVKLNPGWNLPEKAEGKSLF